MNTIEIKAMPNHSAKTHTVKKYIGGKLSAVYRTTKMSKDEFKSCLYNTPNDWAQFLKYSNDYYTVK